MFYGKVCRNALEYLRSVDEMPTIHSGALPQRIKSNTIPVATRALLGMSWRGTSHRDENRELLIR
jgi:hypothetical protein